MKTIYIFSTVLTIITAFYTFLMLNAVSVSFFAIVILNQIFSTYLYVKGQPNYLSLYESKLKEMEDRIESSISKKAEISEAKYKDVADRLNGLALATQTVSSIKKTREAGESVKYKF